MAYLREEEAQAILDAGYAICPRCDGKLSVSTERRFLTKVSKLHCPSCNVFWEDIASFHTEMEQASINTLKKEGLSEPWPFEVPIMLGKGEIVYIVRSQVEFHEGRKQTFRSSGMGVSLRMAKGFWIHPRVGAGSAESEDIMKLIDVGSLVLTNRRLVFVGEKRSISTELGDLLAVDADVDTGQTGYLYVAKEGKQRVEAYLMPMPNLMKEFILLAHEKNVLKG